MNLPSLILASRSIARIAMLEQAGLVFSTEPADIDEAALKGGEPSETATLLAREKARAISLHHPDAFVIGGDQVLSYDGTLFSKATTSEEAQAVLKTLRGGVHELISAACVVQGGSVLWEHADKARMYMRDFDDAFLDRYIERAGEMTTYCVGGYALERHGAWLFEKVEGDYFTVLGLPLLPLLGFLASKGYGP